MAKRALGVSAMLGRRPKKSGQEAFGHVDVGKEASYRVQQVLETVTASAQAREPVPFHPDDAPDKNEVLTAPLSGFDSFFQPNAQWSLERAVSEIRATDSISALPENEIGKGGWTFYCLAANVDGEEVMLIRSKSPTWGLKHESKIITVFFESALELIDEAVIAFDLSADALVIGSQVYVLRPRQLEDLLIDADAVRARAPEITRAFVSGVKASLDPKTVDALALLCSKDATVGRRISRLTRESDLGRITAKGLRDALPDAGRDRFDFGRSGPLQAVTETDALVLVNLAADLYYQPRFSDGPRRVQAFRSVLNR